MSRASHSQFSFADLELQNLGIRLDPTLQAVSDFLDRQQHLVDKIRQDLERGLKSPRTGREGMSPAQVLRSLVLMRIKNCVVNHLKTKFSEPGSRGQHHLRRRRRVICPIIRPSL